MTDDDVPRQTDNPSLFFSDEPDDFPGRLHTQMFHMRTDRGQRGSDIAGENMVVAADDADILRHPDIVFLQRFHAAESTQIVGGENGVRKPVPLLQVAVHGPVGGGALKAAGQDIFFPQRDPCLPEGIREPVQALDAVVVAGHAEDVHQIPVSKSQQVFRLLSYL